MDAVFVVSLHEYKRNWENKTVERQSEKRRATSVACCEKLNFVYNYINSPAEHSTESAVLRLF
jgi:hypothetical protein